MLDQPRAAGIRPSLSARAALAPPRIAIVHEWLDTFAGSERVLEQLLACYPTADLFAVVDFMSERDRAFLQGRPVTTSFVQRLPLARKHFRSYLGLMPIAMEQLNLRQYDLVISSSHAVAKGVITGPGQLHISYVHSPMRYAWDLQQEYLEQSNMTRGLKSIYARWLLSGLRRWDAHTANGVDHFVANSSYIADRIWKFYRRSATVIHPPVDVEGFGLSTDKAAYSLVASRQVAYKRIDIIAEAFAAMPQRKLIIVGDGPEHDKIVKAAQGARNIEIRDAAPRAELIELMQSASCFMVAAEEDFGIATVEAQACGTPVIAFGRGGTRDIVRTQPGDAPTGVLFWEQSAPAIIEAMRVFDAVRDDIAPQACRDNALRFSESAFRSGMTELVDDAMRAGSGPVGGRA